MMYIAGKKEANSTFGKIIQAYTYAPWYKGVRYCHVELVFSNFEWFSAREFQNAVSFSYGPPSGDVLEQYDLFSLDSITKEREERIRRWCTSEMRRDDGSPCKYDVRGVLFSFLPIPIGWQSAEDWFCSEICAAALQYDGWLSGYSACSLSPRKCIELVLKERTKYEIDTTVDNFLTNWMHFAASDTRNG